MRILRALPILLALSLWDCAVLAGQKTIYLAHQNSNNSETTATGAAAVAFKRAAVQFSDSKLQVEIFPRGQLGNDSDVLDLVRHGVIQVAISSVSGVRHHYPMVEVLDFPFAWESLEQTYAVFGGPFGAKFGLGLLRKTGLRNLGYVDSGGFFALTNNKHAIRSPDDMKGLRIRTMGLETHKQFIRSLGADPVAVPWNDLVTALQTGVADGQMNPASIVRFARLDDVQSHLTVTRHLYTPYFFVINANYYDGLSDSERSAIERAAAVGVAASQDLANRNRSKILHELARRMKIHYPTKDELAAFRMASQPAIRDHIRLKLGKEGTTLLNSFLSAIEGSRPNG
jgi:tripartite ATP-independent transporter DctP family solute receptor